MIASPRITAPANITAPCPALEGLPELANMGDLLEVSIRNNQEYAECAAKHKALAELVK
jgi:hypothetical protein